MNFIDIASWQAGLDLQTVFAMNLSLDGVIVKSSGGTSYINPQCETWVQWLIRSGKPWGFYHYLVENNKATSGKAEAEFFAKNFRSYFGHGIPFADYESGAVKQGVGYLKEFLDTVYSLTGVKPVVYCSLSVVQSQDFSAIAGAGYKLWVAQYADNNPVYGFVENPWQKGSVSPFSGYIMQQYTAHGQLAGWSGNLDFNKFMGSYASWLELARGEEAPPEPTLKSADPEVVADVLANRYGYGEDRKQRLTEAGYDYKSVQDMINTCYGVALSCRKYLLPYEEYINSIIKIVRLL